LLHNINELEQKENQSLSIKLLISEFYIFQNIYIHFLMFNYSFYKIIYHIWLL